MKNTSRPCLKTALAHVLRSARKLQRLTQEDFALVSSRTYLSSLERGLKSPTIDKLEEISSVLGTTPAALLLAAEIMCSDSHPDDVKKSVLDQALRLSSRQ